MSLFFCGLFLLGVVLGGLVLLVIYSLLAMAQKGERFLYHLESEERRVQEYAPSPMIRENPEKLGVPATSDLNQESGMPPRIFLRG